MDLRCVDFINDHSQCSENRIIRSLRINTLVGKWWFSLSVEENRTGKKIARKEREGKSLKSKIENEMFNMY